MAPRSPKRLASAKPASKSTPATKKRKPTRKKKELSFSCYRVVEGLTVHYFESPQESRLGIAAMGADGKAQKITIKSNADLVKLLRENTL